MKSTKGGHNVNALGVLGATPFLALFSAKNHVVEAVYFPELLPQADQAKCSELESRSNHTRPSPLVILHQCSLFSLLSLVDRTTGVVPPAGGHSRLI